MTNAARFTLREGIIHLDVEDGTSRLLDLGNRFYGLSAVATRMLRATLAAGPEAAAESLAGECGVPPERMRGDLTAFLASLERKRLIRPSNATVGRTYSSLGWVTLLPLLWCARLIPGERGKTWLLLALATLSCRIFGWMHTVKLWRAGCPRSATPAADPDAVIRDIDFITRSVAAAHPLPAECKERALTTWGLARIAGARVEVVVGVRPFPLQGHCWCSYNGAVYSDDFERCSQFRPVWRCS